MQPSRASELLVLCQHAVKLAVSSEHPGVLTSFPRPCGDFDPVMCLCSAQRSGRAPQNTRPICNPAVPTVLCICTRELQSSIKSFFLKTTLDRLTFSWLQIIPPLILILGAHNIGKNTRGLLSYILSLSTSFVSAGEQNTHPSANQNSIHMFIIPQRVRQMC